MKVYFYDRESGIYQGEGFETNSYAIGEEGVTLVAPPDYDPGLVPVFDRRRGEWLIEKNGHGGGRTASPETTSLNVPATACRL